MPLFEYLCHECTAITEILVITAGDPVRCSSCGSENLSKLLSAHSSSSGTGGQRLPGDGDTACCGSSPSTAGCAGPGSCCGKA